MEQNSTMLADALAKQREDALKEFVNIMEEEVILPSLGKVYECGAKSIKVRPMRGVEEDILTNQKLVRNGRAFDLLLQNCVTEWNGIGFDELLYGDMNTIFAAIRSISLGSDYGVNIQCEECGEKQDEDIDLNTFKQKYLEIDPITVGKNIFI